MRSDYNIAPPSSAERLADGLVQSMNVVLAVAGCVVLGVLGTHADPLRLAAVTVYGAGLLAMVGTSALYAWARGGSHHRLYRHFDHAAIFLMIAGTYTPFTLISFGGGVHGRWLLALIWAVALVGVLLKLIAPRRVEPLSIPLYLIMGWAVLFDPGLLLSLPASVVTLLLAGGVFYTVGLTFHRVRVRFQEAIWHCFVLAAATCHYAAVAYIVA